MFNFEYASSDNEQAENRTGNDPPLVYQETGSDHEKEPYINKLNFINSINSLNLFIANQKRTCSEIEQVSFCEAEKEEKEEKICGKKEEKEKYERSCGGGSSTGKNLIDQDGSEIPPRLESVKDFFKSESYPEEEAMKFYHYFSSNGWLVGGRSPMKNWHAGSHSWMLLSTKFKGHEIDKRNKTNLDPGHLHDANDRNKDYSEPL